MLKVELFRRVNERRRKLKLNPITREEFIKAITNLELLGMLTTDGEHCHTKGQQEISSAGETE